MRHQVFGTGKKKDIGLIGVKVPWQSFVGLPDDRRNRKVPAEAEATLAGAGVVVQRQLRTEAATCYLNRMYVRVVKPAD